MGARSATASSTFSRTNPERRIALLSVVKAILAVAADRCHAEDSDFDILESHSE
jgi:hypothetical protein